MASQPTALIHSEDANTLFEKYTIPPSAIHVDPHVVYCQDAIPVASPCSSSHDNDSRATNLASSDIPGVPRVASDLQLPQGWTVSSEHRSGIALETNIGTLGELYQALSELGDQLPGPMAAAFETQQRNQATSTLAPSVQTDTKEPTDTPTVLSPGCVSRFTHKLSQYPNTVFDSLIRIYLHCVSYPRLHHTRFLEKIHKGLLHPALVCSIYALSAVHAMVCHPDQFGVYPFMEQLAHDCYNLAHELVEFDQASKTTIETLVLMHKYRVATGDTEGTLFFLAVRHLTWLLTQQGKIGRDVERLRAWMLQQDLSLAIRSLTNPIMAVPDTWMFGADADDSLKLLAMELDGLVMTVRKQEGPLEAWRKSIRHAFPFDPTNPDVRALRLHIVYFGGKLHIHQHHMMQTHTDHGANKQDKLNWAICLQEAPLSSTTVKIKTSLHECMQAAFGFIKAVWICLDLNERCMILEFVDTLSVAFTVLCLGLKIIPDARGPGQAIMARLVQAFASSPPMMACVGIRQFVVHWQNQTCTSLYQNT